MTVAATVLASATAATALSQVKWMAVPQMPSGIPSAAAQQDAARPRGQQAYQDNAVPERGVNRSHDEGDCQPQDPKSSDRPASQQRSPGWARFLVA